MQNKPKVNKASKELAKHRVTSKIQDRFAEVLKDKEMRMKKLKAKYEKIEEDKFNNSCLFQPNKKPINLSKSLTFGHNDSLAQKTYGSRESSVVSARSTKSANSFYERSINLKRIKEDRINKLRY